LEFIKEFIALPSSTTKSIIYNESFSHSLAHVGWLAKQNCSNNIMEKRKNVISVRGIVYKNSFKTFLQSLLPVVVCRRHETKAGADE